MFSATKWKNTVLSIVFFLGLISLLNNGYQWYVNRAKIIDVKIENAVQSKKIIKVEIEKATKVIDSLKDLQEDVEDDIYKSVKDFYKDKEKNEKKIKENEKDIFTTTTDTIDIYKFLSKYIATPLF